LFATIELTVGNRSQLKTVLETASIEFLKAMENWECGLAAVVFFGQPSMPIPVFRDHVAGGAVSGNAPGLCAICRKS
jgi:hypothetical protein